MDRDYIVIHSKVSGFGAENPKTEDCRKYSLAPFMQVAVFIF